MKGEEKEVMVKLIRCLYVCAVVGGGGGGGVPGGGGWMVGMADWCVSQLHPTQTTTLHDFFKILLTKAL